MKAFLFYPPGKQFQRGEDRCQANVDASPTMTQRAPIDMMYVAAILKEKGIKCKFVDYPTEGKTWEDFERDVKKFSPDIAIMSVTTSSVLHDMKAFKIIKSINEECKTIAKGSIFFVAPKTVFEKFEEFKYMDIAVKGEIEFTIASIVDNLNKPENVNGILFWKRKKLKDTGRPVFGNLDDLPFPDRSIVRNELYIRPDTGEAQTTIETSRGCPGLCIYCLTPIISGRAPRYRSAKSIADEIEECVEKYDIRNFFFRSDTFTMNRKLVKEVCREIVERGLDINWVANSRVDTIDAETLRYMKKSGCWLIAFGFETGSDESKKKIGKFTTVKQDIAARELCKKFGIYTYGFFMMGFPWETRNDIEATINHMFKLDCEFVELHIAIPFYGTKLYEICKREGLIKHEIIGADYFENPPVGTKYVSAEELIRIREEALKKYYTRSSYIARMLLKAKNPKVMANYIKYGIKLLKWK